MFHKYRLVNHSFVILFKITRFIESNNVELALKNQLLKSNQNHFQLLFLSIKYFIYLCIKVLDFLIKIWYNICINKEVKNKLL